MRDRRSRPRFRRWWGALAPAGVVALLLVSCGGGDNDRQPGPTPTVQAGADGPLGEFVVFGSEPVAFDFAPDGRLFFTLRQEGEIRWVDLSAVGEGGAPESERGHRFAVLDVFVGSECGLLGIAVDPEFEQNHYVYVYVTQPDPSSSESGNPRVIRFTDVDGEGTDPTPIVDDLPLTNPTTCAHVGGNLHFGPDGYLYVSVGNSELRPVAHDLGSPLGKILRLNRDGSAAAGNPFAGDPNADERVFAYGLRNPWDFAFHPDTGKIYAPDNGQGLCDELNIIEAGQDYGVPDSLPPSGVTAPSCLGLGGVDPIYLFALPGKKPEEPESNVAPAGVAFAKAGTYTELGTGLLVCAFNTQEMHYLAFEGPNQDRVREDITVLHHCPFNVEVDAAGTIYYAIVKAFDPGFSGTSGIYRLTPADVTELLGQSSP